MSAIVGVPGDVAHQLSGHEQNIIGTLSQAPIVESVPAHPPSRGRQGVAGQRQLEIPHTRHGTHIGQ